MVKNLSEIESEARRLSTKVFQLGGAFGGDAGGDGGPVQPTGGHAQLARAQALRQAMREMIANGLYVYDGQALLSYAHPIFWAPLSLVGDGG